MIVIALVFDGLDGRVARMTGTTSRFGMEFDSLADTVAFGAAPAILLFLFCGVEFNKVGVLVSGLFAVFGAIRLARFNVSVGRNEPNVFIGLPIPTAAMFIVSWILLMLEYPEVREYTRYLLFAALVVAALMVSHIRYPSFKSFSVKATDKKKLLVLSVSLLSVLYVFPEEGFALLVTGYIIFGIVRAAYYVFSRSPKIKSS